MAYNLTVFLLYFLWGIKKMIISKNLIKFLKKSDKKRFFFSIFAAKSQTLKLIETTLNWYKMVLLTHNFWRQYLYEGSQVNECAANRTPLECQN